MAKGVKTYKAHIVSGKGGRMKIDGLSVVDAKKPLIFEVTSHDIRNSNPLDPGGCAAAVAAMRIPGVTQALIHLSKVYILLRGKRQWLRHDAPRSLRTEVVAFDRYGEFKPNKFKLMPVCPSQQIESRRESYRLMVPGGKSALPTKSTWKRYKKDYGKTGSKKRRGILTDVRGRPTGFTK